MVDGRDSDGAGKRDRARVRVLREAVADLEAEVRDLQEQLAVLAEAHRRLQAPNGEAGPPAAPEVVPAPPPRGVMPALRRAAKLALRASLGTARRLWRAADPAQRHVVAARLITEISDDLPTLCVVAPAEIDRARVVAMLRAQTASGVELALWSRTSDALELLLPDGEPRRRIESAARDLTGALGADYVIEIPPACPDLPSTLLECVQWLLASERLPVLRVFPRPVEEADRDAAALTVCERSLWRPGSVDLGGLADRARRRPVVGKVVGLAGRLDAAVPRLAPLGEQGRGRVCRTGRYEVWASNRSGPVEHALRRLRPAPSAAADHETLLIVLASPLVGGTAAAVSGIVRRLAGALRVVVVSTAAEHGLGVERALALERLGATVWELGTALAPEVWPSAIERVAGRSTPQAVLAVGSDARLTPALAGIRRGGVRLVALDAADAEPLVDVDARLDQRHLMAGWLLEDGEVDEARRAAVRADLGVAPDRWLVVSAVDLVPTGRPEDVVTVAHRMRSEPDVEVVLVGDGPLAGTVADLAGFLGARVRLRRPRHRLSELAAAADAVLDPSEERVVRPPAAAALAAGVPLVAAPGAGVESLLADVGGVVVSSAVGDVDGLAEAVRRIRIDRLRPDRARAREVLNGQRAASSDAVVRTILGRDSASAEG